MRPTFLRAPAVIGWATLLLAGLALSSALAGGDADRPRWEYKAVAFTNDEVENTARLNDLARDGWEYVGPLAHGQVAFRRRVGSRTPRRRRSTWWVGRGQQPRSATGTPK